MTRLLPACPQVSTANLKAQGQTERPGGPRKTAVSQGARGEEGCSREDQHMKQKHDLAILPFLRLQYPSLHPYQPGQLRSTRIERKSSWGELPNCPWAVCNQMNRQIQSGLQILPSTEIRLLSNDCKNDAQLRRGSALNLNSCFNLSMPPVLSVPAEKETSTCCQHK